MEGNDEKSIVVLMLNEQNLDWEELNLGSC